MQKCDYVADSVKRALYTSFMQMCIVLIADSREELQGLLDIINMHCIIEKQNTSINQRKGSACQGRKLRLQFTHLV